MPDPPQCAAVALQQFGWKAMVVPQTFTTLIVVAVLQVVPLNFVPFQRLFRFGDGPHSP